MTALPTGCASRQCAGRAVASCQRGTASPWQLSIARRLGFRRFDECQTPVASCEDTEEGRALEWLWIGVSSAGETGWNSALDLHFGSTLI